MSLVSTYLGIETHTEGKVENHLREFLKAEKTEFQNTYD